MKNKLLYAISFLWTGWIAFSAPVCLGLIYMHITGYGKGYDYNPGDEKEISVFLGWIELLVWLAAAILPTIRVIRKTKEKGRRYLFVPIAVYAVLFLSGILAIGGFGEFGKFFHA